MAPGTRILRRMHNFTFEYPTSSCSALKRTARRRKMRRYFRTFIRTRKQDGGLMQFFSSQRIRVFLSRLRDFFVPENLKESFLNFMKLLVTNLALRTAFGFTFTFLLLFSILSFQNNISLTVSIPVCAMFGLMVGIIFLISKTFRCVMILSIPHFCTQQGRFVLLAVIASILIGGPLMTLNKNFYEFGKSVQCMSNNTMEQGKKMTRSYRQSYDDFKHFFDLQSEKLYETKAYIDEKLKPMRDVIHVIKQESSKLENIFHNASLDCQLKVEQERINCVLGARRRFDSCKEFEPLKLTKLDDLCELIWISTDVCEGLLFDHYIVCSPVRAAESITSGIKTGVQRLREAFDFYFRIHNKFKRYYKNTINITEIETEILQSFQAPFDFIKAAMTAVKYFFLSSLAWIPVKSWLFLRKIQNGRGQSSRFGFLDRIPHYNERERRKEMLSQGLLLFIHFISSIMIFGIDYSFYKVQNSIRGMSGNASISTNTSYFISMNISVGSAYLFNPFLDFRNHSLISMNRTRSFTFDASARDCFPIPVGSSGVLAFVFVLIFYVIIFIMLIRGNRLLKYRVSIIYFIMPEFRPKEDPTLIPYTSPLATSLIRHTVEMHPAPEPISSPELCSPFSNNRNLESHPTCF